MINDNVGKQNPHRARMTDPVIIYPAFVWSWDFNPSLYFRIMVLQNLGRGTSKMRKNANSPQTRLGQVAQEPAGLPIGESAYCLTSSTLRFLARPSSVSLELTGASGPAPWAMRRAAATPYFVVRAATTASARRLERSIFDARLPTLSVWPTTNNLSCAVCWRSLAISLSGASDSGLTSALAVSK